MTVGLMIVALSWAGAAAQGRSGRTVQLEAGDCSRMQMSFGRDAIGYAVQHQVVPLTSGALELRPGSNGGVKIQRGSGDSYSVTACIGVGAATQQEAQQLADAVRLSVEGTRVGIAGMDRVRNGSVHLIVDAPKGAKLDAQTANGPISVDGFEGELMARASNGPISLDDVAGVVRAEATNGPISIAGSRGQVDVETRNGPITVVLDGREWEGELQARAQNGPLTVSVPEGFQSGVEISSSSNSPWSCRIAACGTATGRDEETPRTLRFGSEPTRVKVSTVNGPVTVNRRQ